MAVISFYYYDRKLEISIPGERLVDKMDADPVPPLDDVYNETLRAIGRPYGTVPLREIVHQKSRVLLAVPDRSRHTDIREVLRAVCDELDEAGVPRSSITILVALGTHRPMNESELRQKLGDGVTRRYTVVNHDYDDMAGLIDLGKTADGLPVQFNRMILEHDVVMSIGNISAHPVGGFSGGAKGLLPGIAGKRSTDYFHWEATKYPLFDIFANADNPVRLEMERIVKKAGLHFIVNTTENAQRRISGVFAGDFVQAHRAGVAFLKKNPLIAFPMAQPDVLVVGSGVDRPDFWGGAAGIYAAAALLKEGGTVMLYAACPEGVAPEHPVVTEYGYPRWEEVQRLVEAGKINDRTGASHLLTVGRILEENNIRVHLVSEGITPEEAAVLGFHYYHDPQAALDDAVKLTGQDAEILAYERI